MDIRPVDRFPACTFDNPTDDHKQVLSFQSKLPDVKTDDKESIEKRDCYWDSTRDNGYGITTNARDFCVHGEASLEKGELKLDGGLNTAA
ncbi:hypothetical protein JDN40_08535 [Rhodomicrobium vannielii ATCC 17100]|uniref:hypothetical protein n=1 Tax=Rhodomicrobium vannielii TaxID=1069 RepID=UPI00191961D0|nr:hypothetical protein [Rhodomicrobium vannielii]MBJ7534150.1 hypothetical protein [Rhodomicrobium vannielii ATCC 17100]